MRNRILSLSLLLLGSGCSSFTPLTVGELARRHQAGESSEALIASIEQSGTRYFLRSEQRVALNNRLPEEVLAAMQPGGTPTVDAVFFDDDYWYGNCETASLDALSLACEPQFAQLIKQLQWPMP